MFGSRSMISELADLEQVLERADLVLFETGSRRRERRVRHFACSDAERTRVGNVLKKSVAAETLRAEVDRAAGAAVSWAMRAVRALPRSGRSAQTRRFFREAFGTSAEAVPRWRKASWSWRDLGELVALRLRRAAEKLDGASVRYFCWGSPAHCPECTDPPSGYYACSSWGQRNVICLGQGFWEDCRARDTVSMASTLLHEALHIYFGQLIRHDEHARYNDVNCYLRFVFRANGLSLPSRVANHCRPAP
jgi:hypothetical protein